MNSLHPDAQSVNKFTIGFGANRAWLNKELQPGYDESTARTHYPRRLDTPEQLYQWMRAGYSVTSAIFKDDYRKTQNFISAQSALGDFDNNIRVTDVLRSETARQYCAAIFPSASSTIVTPKNPNGNYRTRLLIVFSEPITDPAEYKRLVKAVMVRIAGEIGAEFDAASCVPAQQWYGSTNQAEPDYTNFDAVLSVELARQWADELEQAEAAARPPVEPARPTIDLSNPENANRGELYSAAARARILDELGTATAGNRHNVFKSVVPKLIAMQKGGWPGFEGIEGDIHQLGQIVGLGRGEVQSIIKWAQSTVGAKDFKVPERPKQTRRKQAPIRQRTVKSAPAPDTDALPVRFVSDDLTPDTLRTEKTLLIAGETGIGKSAAVAGYVATLPPDTILTAIAQFRTLVLGLHKAFPGTHHYEDADGANQRALGQVKQLATSVSSLHKFDRRGGLAIPDEIEGVLNFVASSTTFRGSEALITYRAFKALVKSAEQLIGMDANLSEIVVRWIEDVRGGKVTVKRYRRAEKRGKVTFLRNQAAATYRIEKLLSHRKGQVYVACSSERKATDLADYFEGQGYRVLKVTRDTSNTPTVKAATINANHERSAYDLVIYDAAWGAGVDVSEPVYALVGIFDRTPLAPEDAIQLFGRVRNARRRYAVVPADSEGYPTKSADELLFAKLQREKWTAKQNHMAAHDGGDYLELARLWAQFEARRLRETAQWRRYFVQRLEADGFTVQANNASAPEAYAETLNQWVKARRDEDWQMVLEAVGRSISDNDLEALRMAGEEITRDMRRCNVRHQIETALAVTTVTDRDRDLENEHKRKAFYRLCDLLAGEQTALEADRAQAEEGRPLQRRSYRTVNRRDLRKLLKTAGFTGTVEEQYQAFIDYFQVERSAAEVTERFSMFTTPEAMRLFEELGHYGNNAQTVPGLCRWLINHFNLKLNSRQRRTAEGKRAMFYQIDAETLAYRVARARRAVRERFLSKNVIDTPNTFLDTSATTPPLAPPTPFTSALLARLKAGKPVNPFSKEHEPCKA